jgi:GDP-4-dehydro-6-deoxy-D-mannose reductase
MKRVLVTGAGGFVGHHLIKKLVSTDDQIFAATYTQSDELAALLPEAQILLGDLTDHSYAKSVIAASRPDVVYHLAALSVVHNDVPRARRALENNLGLQYNLLEELRQSAPQARLLAICSGNVYGAVKPEEVPIQESAPVRPLNAYAVSKLSQEILALQYFYAYQLDVVILRPFNHTGPGQIDQFVIPAFAKQFAKIKMGLSEPVIEVGNLDTARDFTDVTDMVEAYQLAAARAVSGEIYNVGSGRATKIGEILDLLQEISGIKVEVKVDSSRVRAADIPVLVADSAKFRAVTGWEPAVPLKQTLTNVLNYWEEKYVEHK